MGVKPEDVMKVLTMNEVEEGLALKIIEATMKGGKQNVQRTFADYGRGYIYIIKS
jgi:hypothetical protein